MKKLMSLVCALVAGLVLAMPVMADSVGSGTNQSVLTAPGSSTQKQGKKGHHHHHKKGQKKAKTDTTVQQ
jgi:microcompartment protein CcmK/EutM